MVFETEPIQKLTSMHRINRGQFHFIISIINESYCEGQSHTSWQHLCQIPDSPLAQPLKKSPEHSLHRQFLLYRTKSHSSTVGGISLQDIGPYESNAI